MTVRFRDIGFTLVEVLVALVILTIAIAVLATTSISSIRHNSVSGSRTQAAQVLNFLGRLAAGADPALFANDDFSWDYGDLRGSFVELRSEVGRADPDLYRAWIEVLDPVGIGEAQMIHYKVHVCWQNAGTESCLEGDTAGPEKVLEEADPPPLPGIG